MNKYLLVINLILIIVLITDSFQIPYTYKYSHNHGTIKHINMYDGGSSVIDKVKVHNLPKIDITKKAFYNRYTKKMFFVDANISDILFQNNNNQPWKFKLLSIYELENATTLVVNSHYKSLGNNDINSDTDNLISTICNFYDKFQRNSLYDKVMNGFLSRSYGRLYQPSLDYHYESLIIAAYHNVTNVLVGIVELYPTQETYLCNLAIHQNYRRMGLATSLCQLSEKIAYYAWNSDSLTLHVDRYNTEAKELYEKLNYSALDNTNKKSHITLENIMLGEWNLITYKKKLEYLNE